MRISRNGRTVSGFELSKQGTTLSKSNTFGPKPSALGTLGTGTSYEEAINSVAPTSELEQTNQYGQTEGIDLTDEQLSEPMGNVAASFDSCGVPDSTKVTVQVAVKYGRAVGVTVTTDPPNDRLAACVDRSVRRLQWPSSPKLDSFTTNY
jgi:hypothetical protein